MPTVADKIADFLSEKGITHAFGIIGAGNLAIFDAIARTKKTQIICCHHEQAAVMAAGFYYRQSGRIAVALVTTGAGSSNAITGALSAFMDSTPVIIISGNEPSKYLNADRRVLGVQGFNTENDARPFVKLSARFANDWNVNLRLDWMIATALAPRMGPIWIDFPRDVQVSHV